MAVIERYRNLYAHEKHSNDALLTMVESVPEARRDDPRFQQAVNLAAHLAACRENWLDRMTGDGLWQADWFEERCEFPTLRARYAAIEARWTAYLAESDDDELDREFTFPIGNGQRFRCVVEGQIQQLVGHGAYHRGQIVLLVDQLGGTTIDTDFLYWESAHNARYGPVGGTGP
jgi:uncharacterized damage-inducible protein DinB